MVYIRGHAHDYDRWQDEGADGWNYDNVLPYFKKAQNHQLGGDAYRGDSGPLNVSVGKFWGSDSLRVGTLMIFKRHFIYGKCKLL